MQAKWEAERSAVVKAFYESAKIDLEAGLLLFNEEEYRYFFSSIISFSLALEKLLKASLFVRSPLLLKKSIEPHDLISLSENPMAFGRSFIKKYQADFVGLEGAWNRLEQFQDHQPLKAFAGLFKDLHRYRNHHVHTFAEVPSKISMKLIFVELWELLEHVFADSTNKISDSKFKTLNEKLEESVLKKLLELQNEFQVNVDFVTEQKETLAWIKAQKNLTTDQFLKYLANRSGEADISSVECPFCNEDKGVTGAILHPEYREDSEGDTVIWEPPSAFSAEFLCFGCIACGAFTDSQSIFEAMDADADLAKPDYVTFEWDLDNGISEVAATKPDRKGSVWGVEVLWF